MYRNMRILMKNRPESYSERINSNLIYRQRCSLFPLAFYIFIYGVLMKLNEANIPSNTGEKVGFQAALVDDLAVVVNLMLVW